ncbi:MAG: simple sugar transport system permease protein [Candidatus Atribacteria bacterium]|nr:simple sugar transport system permease protein [Candidatus Atribacteria bacterium]
MAEQKRDKIFSRGFKFNIEDRVLLLSVVLIVLVIFFGVTKERFLTVNTIRSMAFQCPEIGLMGLGMAIAMIVNGINLSINDTANLSALVAGLSLIELAPLFVGYEFLLVIIAFLIAIGMGIACGALNGLLIGHIGVPPILATLASLTLYRGISVAVTGGKTLTGFPEELSVIGYQTVLGVPIPFIIFLVVGVLMYVVLEHTTFGFKVRMLGTNPTAAKFSGIDNKSITMKVYILSGILGAIAGIIVMSRTNSVAYEYGTRAYILQALLISVLGGISPGFGSIIGVLLATFTLQVISTGFNMLLLGVRGSSFFKDFSWGIIFIVILIIDHLMHRRRGIG